MKKITIIGGGITGLTAAYYLNKKIKEEGLDYQLQLLEASKSLGGKIDTERREGFTIERPFELQRTPCSRCWYW